MLKKEIASIIDMFLQFNCYSMKNRILHLSRIVKQGIVAIVDVLMSIVATWCAFSLRLDVLHWPDGYQWHVYQLAPLLALPVFIRMGLYRAIFRYTGMSAMMTIVKAVAVYEIGRAHV